MINLITAIANLQSGWSAGDVSALVANTDAKFVIVLKIKVPDGKYLGATLEENKGSEIYLYGKSPHWPGIFLTGRLPKTDIRKVKTAINNLKSEKKTIEEKTKAEELIDDFFGKKLMWLPKGTIITSDDLVSELSTQYKEALLSLKKLFENESDSLKKDLQKIIGDLDIDKDESSDLLLTLKFIDESREYYVGEIDEYQKIFKQAIMRPRSLSKKARDPTYCTICNKPAISGVFEHPPLPFFTLDKQNFAPLGDSDLGFKVFPLCQECYMALKRGLAYISQNLDFSIPNSEQKGIPLKFWLIPILNDTSLVKMFLDNMNRGGLYLKNLRSLCTTMAIITTELDTQQEAFESFLSFTALFYTIDKQGHMRLISSEQGIYPKRLREIIKAKTHVDTLYPFSQESIRFGFPLLRDFLEDPKTEGRPSQMSSLMGIIFLGKTANPELIYGSIARKLRDTAAANSLEILKKEALKALMAMEYLVSLKLIELPKNSDRQMPLQTDDPLVNEAEKFLNEHSQLLSNGTLRAICAIGIAVGILLEVQRRRPGGSMPFWGRLNRLEMDLDRVRSLLPQVITKLQQYDEHDYDQLINYIGSQEISGFDPNAKNLSRDLISFVFTIGLSEGHMIVNYGGRR